ncbi:MAG: hypothetical protein M1147_12885 [Nitrospirae bacterium]|nr:hypothetical protein [Nitrospirota bacterium]MCL5978985.1 hypothetical protein [Nitrospirota bacterium]
MMMRKENRFLSVLKPLAVIMLLISVFGIVWLRSSFVTIEYRISSLEKKKNVLMKERKMLAAERASLLSVERIGSATADKFAFPDRVKVVYVRKTKDEEPYRASFAGR